MNRYFILLSLLMTFITLNCETEMIFSYGDPRSEIVSEGDFLWFTSELGLTKFNPVSGEAEYLGTSFSKEYSYGHFIVDVAGNKWFTYSNEYGEHNLIRYDGTVFWNCDTTNSPILGNNVTDLATGSNGDVWVSTSNQGLCKYNSQNNIWSVYNTQNSGIPSDEILSIFVDHADVLWIGGIQQGLTKYDGSSWTHYNSPEWLESLYITCFSEAADSTLWIGSVDGLCSYKNGEFIIYEIFEPIYGIMCVDSVVLVQCEKCSLGRFHPETGVIDDLEYSAMQMSNTGLGAFINVWQGFYKYENGWILLHPGNFYYPANFYDLCYDPVQNEIWTRFENGIAKYDYHWNYFTQQNTNIDFTRVKNTILAPNGIVWCTYLNTNNNDILLSYDGNAWNFHPEAVLPPDTLCSIYCMGIDHQNKIWANISGHVAYYEDETWIGINGGFDIQSSRFEFDEQNQLWFGGYHNKLYRYNGELTVWETDNPNMWSHITAVSAVNDNDVWFADEVKLYHLSGGVLTSFSFPDLSSNVKMITRDNLNHLWIDTYGKLLYFDGISFTVYPYEADSNYGHFLQNMIIDNNQNKWIALREQLYIYNQNGVVENSPDSNPRPAFNLTNYPNPFNPSTTISFSLPISSKVEISVYNIKGQKINTVLNEKMEKGVHSIIWNGTNGKDSVLSSGVYFLRIKSGNRESVKKLLLLK